MMLHRYIRYRRTHAVAVMFDCLLPVFVDCGGCNLFFHHALVRGGIWRRRRLLPGILQSDSSDTMLQHNHRCLELCWYTFCMIFLPNFVILTLNCCFVAPWSLSAVQFAGLPIQNLTLVSSVPPGEAAGFGMDVTFTWRWSQGSGMECTVFKQASDGFTTIGEWTQVKQIYRKYFLFSVRLGIPPNIV